MKNILILIIILSGVSLSVAQTHFTVTPTSGCNEVTAHFDNLHPSNGYIPVPMQTTGFSYEWDFGNGQSSADEDPDSVLNGIGLNADDMESILEDVTASVEQARELVYSGMAK